LAVENKQISARIQLDSWICAVLRAVTWRRWYDAIFATDAQVPN